MKVKEYIVQELKKGYMGAVRLASSKAVAKGASTEIAYLLSFPGNDQGFLKELKQAFPERKVVVYYTDVCRAEAEGLSDSGFIIESLTASVDFFKKVIPRLAKSRLILCDNYFAFLGELILPETTQVIQLWHANGAVKRFGWGDPKTSRRSLEDQQRFQKVYNRFDRIVVSSDRMAQIFKASFHLAEKRMLKIGSPRIDNYFKEDYRQLAIARFQQQFPEARQKKVILYAPTYRDEVLAEPVWWKWLRRLDEDTLLIYKRHPHLEAQVATTDLTDNPRVITDMRGLSLPELLMSVDCLIGDYTSIPFEYSLANPQGQLVFYCPDIADYHKSVGLQEDFVKWSNEACATDLDELLELINRQQSVSLETINEVWNQYNDGQATKRLLAYLKEEALS